MGKKARKTRWRALDIETGDQSDSEESQHTALHSNKGSYYQSHPSYSAAPYHSTHFNGYQSTHYGGVQRSYRAVTGGGAAKFSLVGSQGGAQARGRFSHNHHSTHHQHQHTQSATDASAGKDDESKTTPQMAEAGTGANANGKITFNEDEYTRITTPRQDVLFKKGYLSKPKTYQTQTSTGASTISTGNSTGNGTPDHQSADGTEGTDLEYESQFVFPNGFVDQNGIYYVNSFEPPYPLVVYNPPMCYAEYVPPPRSKRLSTGSLTESTSPHNEETSQELSHSGGETVSYPEYGHGNVYNLVFPGYYGYSVPPEMELAQGEPRKIKKRRRRKLSKPVPEGNWTTSSDDYDESDEMVSEIENRIIQGTHRPPTADSPPSNLPNTEEDVREGEKVEESGELEEIVRVEETEVKGTQVKDVNEEKDAETISDMVVVVASDVVEVTPVENIASEKVNTKEEEPSPAVETVEPTTPPPPPRKALKADAKEFIPRYFHHTPHHRQQHPQFIANLIPLPPPFLHAPPPMHLMPPPHMHVPTQMLPVEVVHAQTSPETHAMHPEAQGAVIATIPQASQTPEVASTLSHEMVPEPHSAIQSSSALQVVVSSDKSLLLPGTVSQVAVTSSPQKNKHIDIAKIVSKLEEAAKEQRRSGPKIGNPRGRRNYSRALPGDNVENRRFVRSEVENQKVRDVKDSSTCTIKQVGPLNGHKNYAQMLCKKSTATSPIKQFSRSPSKEASCTTQTVPINQVHSPSPHHVNHVYTHPHSPKVQSSSQWISVQSRKKRKNKNQECEWDEQEQEEVIEVKTNHSDDGFEAYDVSKLEDVVVKQESLVQPTAEGEKMEVVVAVKEVKKGINAIVVKEEKIVVKAKKGVLVPVVSASDLKAVEEEEFDRLIRTLEELEAKTPQKKKSLTKISSKRVMITDVGVEELLPMTITEVTDVKEMVKPKEEVNKTKKSKRKSKEAPRDVAKEENSVHEVPKDVPAVKLTELTPPGKLPFLPISSPLSAEASEILETAPTVPILESQASAEETQEKKRKKKKKLSKKSSLLETPPTSVPTTPSTSASTDEASYNFMLTDSLLEEERTNLEVSEELDKIIQRGMFTSLEEKIKSLNITASGTDGFFKSLTSFVDSPISKGAKEDDLTTILAKTTNIFKAKRPMCQHNIGQEPSTTGSFLDLASLHEDPGISNLGGGRKEGVITQAVKEWMVRTRETTPEVELLKSPRTILKEIGKDVEEISGGNSIKESWSLTPASSFEDEEDLLECWDDLEETTRILSSNARSSQRRDLQVVVSAEEEKQKQIEASLEVYESLYGKNEDFRQIKAEMEVRKKNGTLPKHGGLPYRAVCCSVM